MTPNEMPKKATVVVTTARRGKVRVGRLHADYNSAMADALKAAGVVK